MVRHPRNSTAYWNYKVAQARLSLTRMRKLLGQPSPFRINQGTFGRATMAKRAIAARIAANRAAAIARRAASRAKPKRNVFISYRRR